MPAQTRKDPAGSVSVSTVITRVVHPGHEAEYNQWMIRTLNEGLTFPHSVRATVPSPDPGHDNVRTLVHTFTDAGSSRVWADSAVCRQLAEEADSFSTLQQHSTGGPSGLLSPGEASPPQPPKWKMALATFVVAYILTAVIIPREQAWIPATWSFYAVNVMTNVLLSVGITYVGLPLVSRLLGRWLTTP